MKKRYIKIPPNFFKPLKYKVNFDWTSYFKIKSLAILEEFLAEIRKGRQIKINTC